MLTAGIILFLGPYLPLPLLVLVFVLHEFLIQVFETSTWKIVKLRCELVFGEDEKKQENMISQIGVLMEICSNFMITSALVVAFLFMSLGQRSFTFSMWSLIAFLCVGDLVAAVVALSVPSSYHASHGNVWAVLPTEDSAIELEERESVELQPSNQFSHDQSSDSDHQQPEESADTSKQPDHGELLGTSSEPTAGQEDYFLDDTLEAKPEGTSVALLSSAKCESIYLCRLAQSVFRFLSKTVLSNGIAVHAIIQIWLLYLYSELVEYPISFSEATSVDCTDLEAHCTPNNFCQGNLRNYILVATLGKSTTTLQGHSSENCGVHYSAEGACNTVREDNRRGEKDAIFLNLIDSCSLTVVFVDNFAYILGAFGYAAFLLNCPPNVFFKWLLPAVSAFLAFLVFVIWTHLFSLPVELFLLGCALAVSSYLDKYNMYFWMSSK